MTVPPKKQITVHLVDDVPHEFLSWYSPNAVQSYNGRVLRVLEIDGAEHNFNLDYVTNWTVENV